jgi:hypothetical protein
MHVMGFSAVEIAAHVSKSEGERGASLVGRDTLRPSRSANVPGGPFLTIRSVKIRLCPWKFLLTAFARPCATHRSNPQVCGPSAGAGSIPVRLTSFASRGDVAHSPLRHCR